VSVVGVAAARGSELFEGDSARPALAPSRARDVFPAHLGVRRPTVTWLLTLPLAVVGSQVAHSLGYRLVTPRDAERSHDLAATGHSYLTYAPVLLALCLVLVALALAGELRQLMARSCRGPTRPSALCFAVSAPAIFVCQEHLERLLHDGAFPWTAALQSTFIVGLLLQLPFALAAYLVAWFLLRAVGSLHLILASRPRLRLRGGEVLRPSTRLLAPRVPALALGYGPRGPPALLAA
jgi:hypothetical protein